MNKLILLTNITKMTTTEVDVDMDVGKGMPGVGQVQLEIQVVVEDQTGNLIISSFESPNLIMVC